MKKHLFFQVVNMVKKLSSSLKFRMLFLATKVENVYKMAENYNFFLFSSQIQFNCSYESTYHMKKHLFFQGINMVKKLSSSLKFRMLFLATKVEKVYKMFEKYTFFLFSTPIQFNCSYESIYHMKKHLFFPNFFI